MSHNIYITAANSYLPKRILRLKISVLQIHFKILLDSV